MIIKDNTSKVVSEVVALKTYFGMKEGQKLQEFMDECKHLSPEAKTELAVGAAKELGWTVEPDVAKVA